MMLKIDEINRKIRIELNADEWFIGRVDDEKYVWEYALMAQIDRSYKGKEPDIACPKILLTQEEYEKLKGLVVEVFGADDPD